MARHKRIFREWQHPRDNAGKFSRKGGEAWVKRAAEAFKSATPSLKEGSAPPASAPGRPRIGQGAKAAKLFAAHQPGVDTGLSKPYTPKKAAPKAKRPSTFELGPKSKSSSEYGVKPKVPAAKTGTDHGKLSDAQLEHGLVMHGNTSPKGKAIQAEVDRRKLAAARASEAAAPKRESGLAALAAGAHARAAEDAAKGPGTKLGTSGHLLTPQEREAKLRAARASEASSVVSGRESGLAHLSPEGRAKLDAQMQTKLNEGRNSGAGNLGADILGPADGGAGDVMRQIRARPTHEVPPTVGENSYAGMKRHTLVSLAGLAGIKATGKSNGDLARELAAKDDQVKASRAAKLNPGRVGKPSGPAKPARKAAAPRVAKAASSAPAAYKYQGAGTPERIAHYQAMDEGALRDLAKSRGLIVDGRSKNQLVDALADSDASKKQVLQVGAGAIENVGPRISPLTRTEVGGWKGGRGKA